jgi:hypothetical protein
MADVRAGRVRRAGMAGNSGDGLPGSWRRSPGAVNRGN